jgi:hypothetical protein
LTADSEAIEAFVARLSELLAPGARVRREADGAIAISRVDRDGSAELVVLTRPPRADELKPCLRDLAASGVAMVAFVSAETGEQRVWDRFAWQWEERDVVDPAECDPLGIAHAVERHDRETRLVVTSQPSGHRAVHLAASRPSGDARS